MIINKLDELGTVESYHWPTDDYIRDVIHTSHRVGDKFTGSNVITLSDGTHWERDKGSEIMISEHRYYRGLVKTGKFWWQFWKSEYVYSGAVAYGDNPLEID